MDFSLERSQEEVAADLHRYLKKTEHTQLARRIADVRKLSMLHEDALTLLVLFGESSRGPVLEIGPYIGGSTIAMATGLGDSGNPLVTIEVGGAYEDHPSLPTHDVLGDLRKNLKRFKVTKRVEIVEGLASSPATRRKVGERLSGRSAGLIFIDADGHVDWTLADYARHLRDDCLIVIDDYIAPGALEKEVIVRPFVDRLVQEEILRRFGVFGDGTWFGQVNGAAGRAALRRVAPAFIHDAGFCFRGLLESSEPADEVSNNGRSALRLFEDGRALGPAHSLHESIRHEGKGRFSHWSSSAAPAEKAPFVSSVYFSASDNSDPNSNGRLYTVEVNETQVDLRPAR